MPCPVHLLLAFGASFTPFEATSPYDDERLLSCLGESDDFICECERLIHKKTNAVRKAAGKPALSFNPKISVVARLWSKQQAGQGKISHAWFEDGTWEKKYRERYSGGSTVDAENVAYNYDLDTPEECADVFVKQWKDSPGHYKNMLGSHKTLGVGVARGSNGKYYATQNFGG